MSGPILTGKRIPTSGGKLTALLAVRDVPDIEVVPDTEDVPDAEDVPGLQAPQSQSARMMHGRYRSVCSEMSFWSWKQLRDYSLKSR